ncbi:hypothetical protein BDZ89DRAFT_529995 [Hymenopellis radicata]|nr:hypothetical protein BDZ89DRAFT_529995 [Hymenopellis radicata]
MQSHTPAVVLLPQPRAYSSLCCLAWRAYAGVWHCSGSGTSSYTSLQARIADRAASMRGLTREPWYYTSRWRRRKVGLPTLCNDSKSVTGAAASLRVVAVDSRWRGLSSRASSASMMVARGQEIESEHCSDSRSVSPPPNREDVVVDGGRTACPGVLVFNKRYFV